MSSAHAGVSIDDSFRLSALYAAGELVDVDPAERSAAPDGALNDKVYIWRGDITTLAVDAIVNAANKSLLGGGGVDGAIHSAAGPGLLAECKTLNGADTGETKITKGYELPAKHVLHTVGPVYSSSHEAACQEKLRSCYQSCLDLAAGHALKTIAFSGISTGIYGYPLDAATQVALDVVRAFLASPAGAPIDKVIFTVFRPIDVQAYKTNTPIFFPSVSASGSATLADATKAAVASDAAVPTSSTSFDPPPAVADSTEVWATGTEVPFVQAESGKAVQAEVPSRTWTPQPEGSLAAAMKMPPAPKEDEAVDSDADPGAWSEVKTDKKTPKIGEDLLEKVRKKD